MRIGIEEKKAEAIQRMKLLHIYGPTIQQFANEGLVSVSEPPFGAFYWVNDEDLKRVKEFEERHNALVFVIVRSYTNIGKLDSFLYVSDYQEEWERDRENIKHGEPIAYVYNHDMPDCSEAGPIGVALTPAAGLRRTW